MRQARRPAINRFLTSCYEEERTLATPCAYLRTGGFIRLFGIAQRRLQMLVPQSRTKGRYTYSAVDELSRVRMSKLVERAGDPCLRAVVIPAFLYRRAM